MAVTEVHAIDNVKPNANDPTKLVAITKMYSMYRQVFEELERPLRAIELVALL